MRLVLAVLIALVIFVPRPARAVLNITYESQQPVSGQTCSDQNAPDGRISGQAEWMTGLGTGSYLRFMVGQVEQGFGDLYRFVMWGGDKEPEWYDYYPSLDRWYHPDRLPAPTPPPNP